MYIAPPGTKIGLVFPKAGKKPEAGLRRLHGRRLLQERHERVRLDPRLRPARAAAEHAAADATPTAAGRSTRSRSRSSRASNLDELAETAPDWRSSGCGRCSSGSATWEQKQGPLLAAVGDRAEHPEHPPVLDHRRGRVRHPGDLLDDRGREDARHRHPEGAGGLDRRASAGSSSATACCWAWSAAASGMVGGLLFVRYINEIEKCLSTVTRPQGVRRHDLLLRQDPDPGRAAAPWSGSWSGRCSSPCWPASGRRSGRRGCTRCGRCGSNDRAARLGAASPFASTDPRSQSFQGRRGR